MLKQPLWTRLLLAGAGLLFFAAAAHLLQLRFQHGDIYPAYSSLRADPLGTKVLYQALDELPGGETSRNFHPLRKLTSSAPTTVYVLGNDFENLDPISPLQLAKAGMRVVWALKSISAAQATPTPAPSPGSKSREFYHSVFELEIKQARATAEAATARAELPARIPWHSDAYLVEPPSPWHVIYRVGGRAVIVERTWGRGSLVVATDSYLLSNEAMLNDRQPALLAWLQGAGTQIVFDETHLKVEEHEGMMSLFRKYRLLGLLGALAVLAALFAWRQIASLVPPFRETGAEDTAPVLGRDAQAGFISLLRRSVPPRELLATCVAEWELSSARPHHPARRQKMDAALAEAAARPVATYQALHQILADKSR